MGNGNDEEMRSLGKTNGTLRVTTEANKLTLEGFDGLATAVFMDKSGMVMMLFHPLTGWEVRHDGRRDVQPEDSASDAGATQ